MFDVSAEERVVNRETPALRNPTVDVGDKQWDNSNRDG